MTVFGSTTQNANGASDWYKLDQQDFHVTEVVGSDKDTKYSIVAPGTLYAKKDSGHSVKVKVKATTDNGETYEIAGDRISLTLDSRWTVTNNEISGLVADGAVSGTGSVEATVWVTTPLGAKVEAGTVAIAYSDAAPVATKAKLEYASAQNGNFADGRVGSKVSGTVSDIELGDNGTNAATAEIKAGVLTIKDANSVRDTVTAKIVDQYGVTMTNTTFYLDGDEIQDGDSIAMNDRGAIEYRSGNVTDKFYFTTDAGALVFTLTGANAESYEIAKTTADQLLFNNTTTQTNIWTVRDSKANTIAEAQTAITITDGDGNVYGIKGSTATVSTFGVTDNADGTITVTTSAYSQIKPGAYTLTVKNETAGSLSTSFTVAPGAPTVTVAADLALTSIQESADGAELTVVAGTMTNGETNYGTWTLESTTGIVYGSYTGAVVAGGAVNTITMDVVNQLATTAASAGTFAAEAYVLREALI